jgi:EAL domain-containing protein (putative c-di-GMP-specific phosphodiesterase class I)
LRYQPLINLKTKEIVSCEALIRWNHPELGQVSPAEFIPIAEDIGLIGAIGEWVLEKACKAAALWPKSVRVAVNLSPIQFKNADLDKTILHALSITGLPAERLEVEITESLFLESSDTTRGILNSLRNLGVRIALDDFGTGYSSLSYLRSYPFDKIKIDQCFIRDIQSGNDSLAIIKSVIGLGHSLGMVTTAEGVETAGQLEKLLEAGCSEAQGYYFFRPQTETQLTQILADGRQPGMVRAA